MAAAAEAAVFARSFLDKVEVANANSIRNGLRMLEERELVRKQSREWSVADPFFRLWLVKRGNP